MSSQSIFVPVQIIVQLDNAVQPPQWNAPVLLGGANVVTDQAGSAIYQPAFTQRPMAASDVTDEMLVALSAKLAELGLQVSRIEQSMEA